MKSSGKFIGIVILVALCALAALAAYSSVIETRAQEDIDNTTHEQAAIIDRDSVPVIDTDENGEAVTVYGAYELDQVGRHYNDQMIGLAETGYQSLLTMNEQDNETVQKVVRNMAWPPAVIMICIALVIFALAFIVWLSKQPAKGTK